MHPGVKLQNATIEFLAAEFLLQRVDQFLAVFAGNVSGGEVAHVAIGSMHEIAADGPIVRPEADAHRSGLERRTAGIDLKRVIAEERERRDI